MGLTPEQMMMMQQQQQQQAGLGLARSWPPLSPPFLAVLLCTLLASGSLCPLLEVLPQTVSLRPWSLTFKRGPFLVGLPQKPKTSERTALRELKKYATYFLVVVAALRRGTPPPPNSLTRPSTLFNVPNLCVATIWPRMGRPVGRARPPQPPPRPALLPALSRLAPAVLPEGLGFGAKAAAEQD